MLTGEPTTCHTVAEAESASRQIEAMERAAQAQAETWEEKERQLIMQLHSERVSNGETAQRADALQQKLAHANVKIVAQTAKCKLGERKLRAAERNMQTQQALVEKLSGQLVAAKQMDAEKLLQGLLQVTLSREEKFGLLQSLLEM
eukprot:COSAG01_NODE_15965_length_1282_cov_1.822485_2_plen_146_part_00